MSLLQDENLNEKSVDEVDKVASDWYGASSMGVFSIFYISCFL